MGSDFGPLYRHHYASRRMEPWMPMKSLCQGARAEKACHGLHLEILRRHHEGISDSSVFAQIGEGFAHARGPRLGRPYPRGDCFGYFCHYGYFSCLLHLGLTVGDLGKRRSRARRPEPSAMTLFVKGYHQRLVVESCGHEWVRAASSLLLFQTWYVRII